MSKYNVHNLTEKQAIFAHNLHIAFLKTEGVAEAKLPHKDIYVEYYHKKYGVPYEEVNMENRGQAKLELFDLKYGGKLNE